MVLFICTIGDFYMKITKETLKKIIKEEYTRLLEGDVVQFPTSRIKATPPASGKEVTGKLAPVTSIAKPPDLSQKVEPGSPLAKNEGSPPPVYLGFVYDIGGNIHHIYKIAFNPNVKEYKPTKDYSYFVSVRDDIINSPYALTLGHREPISDGITSEDFKKMIETNRGGSPFHPGSHRPFTGRGPGQPLHV